MHSLHAKVIVVAAQSHKPPCIYPAEKIEFHDVSASKSKVHFNNQVIWQRYIRQKINSIVYANQINADYIIMLIKIIRERKTLVKIVVRFENGITNIKSTALQPLTICEICHVLNKSPRPIPRKIYESHGKRGK